MDMWDRDGLEFTGRIRLGHMQSKRDVLGFRQGFHGKVTLGGMCFGCFQDWILYFFFFLFEKRNVLLYCLVSQEYLCCVELPVP